MIHPRIPLYQRSNVDRSTTRSPSWKFYANPRPRRLSRKLNAFVPEVATEVVKCCFLLICRVNKRREARLREYLRSVTICRGFYDGRRGGGGRVEWKRMEKWKVNSKMAGLVRCFTMMGRCFKSWKRFDCIVTNHGTPRVLCLAFQPYCLVTRFCDPRLFVNNTNGIGSLSTWILSGSVSSIFRDGICLLLNRILFHLRAKSLWWIRSSGVGHQFSSIILIYRYINFPISIGSENFYGVRFCTSSSDYNYREV